jgi:hypothetical protein
MELQSRSHRLHRGPDSPDWLERYETPGSCRPNEVKVQVHVCAGARHRRPRDWRACANGSRCSTLTCEPGRVLAVGRPGSIRSRSRRRDQGPDGNGGREISSGTARGSSDTAPGRPASRVRAYPPMARASSCPGRPASSSQAATGHRTSINRCGGTARPSGKSSPESSKRMTPLHSRLHPCSGWKATMWAASRSGRSAGGQGG